MERRAALASLIVVVFGLSALGSLGLGNLHTGILPQSHPPASAAPPASGPSLPTVTASALADAPRSPAFIHPGYSPSATVILPNGTITGHAAPITQSGNVYSITAGFTGGIVDLRNGSTIDGHGKNLNVSANVSAGVYSTGTTGVTAQNIVFTNASTAVLLLSTANAAVRNCTANSGSTLVSSQSSSNTAITNNSDPRGFVYAVFDTGVTIWGNTIWGSSGTPILVEFSSNAVIDHNIANNSGNGIEAYYSGSVWIENNKVDHSGMDGIITYLNSRATIVNNSASYAVRYGLYSYSTNWLSASYNQFQHSNYSEYVEYGSTAVLSHENGSSEFYYGAEVEYVQYVWITNSTYPGAGYEGAYVYEASSVLIADNNLSSWYYDGADVEYAANANISGNTITMPLYAYGDAVYLDSVTFVTVWNNRAPGAYDGAYVDYSSHVMVADNNFSRGASTGAGVDVEYSNAVSVVHNYLYASYRAVYAYHDSGLWIQDNNASFAFDYGLYVQYVSGATITGNDASHAQNMGLYLLDSPGYFVGDNRFGYEASPSGAGIFAELSSGGTIANNTILRTNYSLEVVICSDVSVVGNNASQSYYGIYLADNANVTVVGNTFWNDHNGWLAAAEGPTWIYHNNFVADQGWVNISSFQEISWDSGYPGGGNYWSNHTGPDVKSGPTQSAPGSDGIVDTPFVINATNVDHYPLAAPWKNVWLQFTESGLPSGTSWSVTVNGQRVTGATATLDYLVTTAAPSAFAYTTSSIAGYRTSASGSGSGMTSRTNQSFAITFSPFTYNVTFSETGLPAGTSWTVTVDGQSTAGTTASLVVNAANGSHTFSVGAISNFVVIHNASGTVTVAGSTVGVAVTFFNTTPPKSPHGTTNTTSTGFSGTTFYSVLALAILLGILAVVGFALWAGARRPKQPAAAWSPPPTGGTGGTPPPATGGPSSPPATSGGGAPPPGAM